MNWKELLGVGTLGLGGAFRERVWLDRYLVYLCLCSAGVAVGAFQHGNTKRGIVLLSVTLLAVLVAPRRGIVFASATGFVALQSLFSAVVRQDSRGLPITLVALALTVGGCLYASKRHEKWPEGSTNFGSLGLAIEAAVFLFLFWAVVRFT
jgi:hypothetical protein